MTHEWHSCLNKVAAVEPIKNNCSCNVDIYNTNYFVALICKVVVNFS